MNVKEWLIEWLTGRERLIAATTPGRRQADRRWLRGCNQDGMGVAEAIRHDDLTFIVDARTSLPQAVAAIRAVLDLKAQWESQPPYAWESQDGWSDGYQQALDAVQGTIAKALGVEL